MSVQIHRCRFLNCDRSGISAIKLNYSPTSLTNAHPPDLRMALGRMNGDIEIWDPLHFNLDLLIPGASGRTIEDIEFIKNSTTNCFRLFSVGGSETIVEWDMQTKLPKAMINSDAGVVWSIISSPDQNQLIASTETGTLVVYDLVYNIEVVKRINVADCSIVSMCFISNDLIACGCHDGHIRIVNLQTKTVVSDLKVDKSKIRNPHPNSTSFDEETVVWSVKFNNQTNQLISGDSNGFVKVWDMKNFTLVQSFSAHEGDVLCIEIGNESVFSCGLDQKIINFQQTSHNKWTPMSSEVNHTHDIRSLKLINSSKLNVIVSGGMEPAFAVNELNASEMISQSHKVVSRGVVQAFNNGNKIMEFSNACFQLWELNETGRKLIAKIELNDEFITGCSFKNDVVVLSTLLQVKVFTVKQNEITLIKTYDFGLHCVQFVEPHTLLYINLDNEVVLHDISNDTKKLLVQNEDAVTSLPYANNLSLLAASQGLFALARFNKISVYTLSGKLMCSLPALPAKPTALTFLNNASLVVCCADQTVFEFNLKGQLTPFSRVNTSNKMPLKLQSQFLPIIGVFADPQNSTRAWMYSQDFLASIDFSSKQPIKREEEEEEETSQKDSLPSFFLTSKYKPIFYAGCVDGKVVVAERPEKVEARRFISNRRILF